MALEQKLSLKLTQKLVMTPSLQQAIKLLQMTRMELDHLLTQELVENPVLEDSREIREDDDGEAPAEQEAADEKKKDDEIDHDESIENIDLDAYFGDYFESSGYASMSEHRDEPPIENSLTRQPDLYDHLLWQLHMSDAAPLEREIAELIIGNLDPDGFLVASVDEICALGCDGSDGSNGRTEPYSSEQVEAALALVRDLDPPGVACRDLRESLLMQLDARLAELREIAEEEAEEAGEELEEWDPPHDLVLARTMIADHWDLFLRRQFAAIAKEMDVELAELESVVELVKTFETRPGRKFSSDRAHYIEPDVYVRRVSGEYVIQLNDDGMPRLRVSRAYRRMLQKMRSDGNEADAQQFIKEKIRSAVWLIKSLDQRQRTIYKVANSIVKQQREFLDHGIDRLRPMVLRDVAEDIEMHESTVSRVVSNKYIHTPRGLFPMKFFFHSGIDREYGDNISSLTVKRKIEKLIESEDPKRPLSDSELMRILNREGIQIARRTVAKYRDELNIPSSTERKKIF
ncbi:MAG TPA: RNA polymerase factor sigma-54 [Thermoanaerobaculia bacterium]|nr:RNA polymerase factor sigma-54 [Thermoanaerobaculia bacterium]